MDKKNTNISSKYYRLRLLKIMKNVGKRLSFLSSYIDKNDDHYIRAIIDKKEYLFSSVQCEYMTNYDFERLEELIKQKL